MFGLSRRPKDPEPEKPERVDLEAIRAERPPVEPPVRVPIPPNPLVGYLGKPHRAALPAVDLVREFDERLAGLIERSVAADSEAVHLQVEFERHQPGGPGFGDVVAQDNAWASGYIKAGGEIPHNAGPLWQWLTAASHELFVAGVHARLESDHADRVVREYGTSVELRDRLDRASDEIQDKIKLHLVEARNSKSRRAYEKAGDLCPSWNIAASLHEWTLNPTVAFRPRNPQAWPAALDVEEYEAATIGLGETRYEAPDRMIGIPSLTVTPAAKSQSSGEVHWGPEGPPGARPAPGVL